MVEILIMTIISLHLIQSVCSELPLLDSLAGALALAPYSTIHLLLISGTLPCGSGSLLQPRLPWLLVPCFELRR